MLFCIIPPQITEALQTVIWDVLRSHGLEPTPLINCERVLLTEPQVRALCVALEFAPVPNPDTIHGPYVIVRLETEHRAARQFLKDALSSTIKGTARAPRWEGGIERSLPVSDPEHPRAFLRELIIVPSDQQREFVTALFAQAESAAA